MELKKIILYLCVCCVACFPSKPLNDRPSELAWQAWLLVDAQNPSEGERRITPKSVFIAPNIGGGDNGSGSVLPECAEGYRSDPMGRCIKFVKVDEAAHLDFLLQRLNAMYATRPTHDLDDDVKPTTGPLQVNIPLRFPAVEEKKDPEIAIIVAPTNGNFDAEEEKEVKFDKRKNEDTTTTEATTTTKEDVTTTTMDPVTTTDDLQALFFLVPMNKTDHVVNRTPATPVAQTATEQTTDEDLDNSTPLDDADTEKGTTDALSFKEPLTPEAHRLSSSEIEHLFKEYISQKPDIVALTSTDLITRRRPISEAVYLDGEEVVPQQYFNHRNRDRSDFWRPASSWREDTLQKPLVLRFNGNRNPYSSERSSSEQQARYYEERQPEEFSQVFGRKRRRGNLR